MGGFITPPPEYFKIVYRIVKNYGGAFISDEVQTGFGRTGRKWFGIEQWEVVPDMITCAKSMGNGVPVGATITTAELADKFQGLTISTFGGNPVTSVAARAVIEVIEEENLLENTYVVGGYFRSKLEELKAKYPLIGDVRGMGMMQGLELVRDRQTKEPAPAEATQSDGTRPRQSAADRQRRPVRERDPHGASDEYHQSRCGRRHPLARQELQRGPGAALERRRQVPRHEPSLRRF